MEDNESIPSASGIPLEGREIIVEDLKAHANTYNLIEGRRIGFSVSDNEDLSSLGYSLIHLKDFVVELTRNLLISGAHIVYGGDLRKEGFTDIFSGLAYQYRSRKEIHQLRYSNYFAYPIYNLLNKENELQFKAARVDVIKVLPPADLQCDATKFISSDSLQKKNIWARSLTEMRERMIAESDARIFVGAKQTFYLGRMAGVLEEFLITIRLGKPVFLVGAFGGITHTIINVLKGGDFSFGNDTFHTSSEYRDFIGYYNEVNPGMQVDFAEIKKMIQEYGLEQLSKSNGLTIDENRRLFESPHLSEILHLIFKGLLNTFKTE